MDLPDINEIIFKKREISSDDGESKIGIYISKESGKWIPADFIDIAVGGIGLHVLLQVQIELTTEELSKTKIKFVKSTNELDESTLKEIPVMIRWQELDSMSGNLKMGLHFGPESKNDEVLMAILKKLKQR